MPRPSASPLYRNQIAAERARIAEMNALVRAFLFRRRIQSWPGFSPPQARMPPCSAA
ncbi:MULTISPECIES: hypothetical protein [unclassified Mesorhizobium]|uniref:hypothetical protein n=1 Tax=unclassified Mesorhizobium TaxID=325217 RepID=UPI0013DFEAD1|nr:MULTISPECIES: hypothetical protein [unclassified Mesorhizobium]MDG4853233.1 hypothetical protein [Mesorhizobium sp. WSM4982]MDG4913201.1 hypothetical protein [Mesorhizobium sp. WSM4983]